MNRSFTKPILICLAPVVIAAIFTIVAIFNYMDDPAKSGRFRFNLGVDLKGGTVLIYEVDRQWWYSRDDQFRSEFNSAQLAAALKRRIDPANQKEISIRAIDATPPRVEITLPTTEQGDELVEQTKTLVGQVGLLEIRLAADSEDKDKQGRDSIGKAVFADAESLVKNYKPEHDNRPEAPAPRDSMKGPTEFQWVPYDPKEVAELKKRVDPNTNQPITLPDGFWREGRTAKFVAKNVLYPDGSRKDRIFLLTRKYPENHEDTVTGKDVAAARPDQDRNGKKVVGFRMTGRGAERFGKLTAGNVGHGMTIIMDDQVVSLATLQAELTDGGIIIMGLSEPELSRSVHNLVLILQSGALPGTLNREPVSTRVIGPRLGAETIRGASIALVVSFALIVVFMLVYYRFGGVVVSVVLLFNLALTVGFMVAVGAVFTLPGMAGLVLSLGMAVDANVLIFERIREERDRGASITLALRNGYDRAFPAIFDSNITTIITCIVLYVLGTVELRGFAVTVILGLIFSLFTGLYMTKVFFEFWHSKGWLRELKMLKFFSKPNIDFMGWRRFWFTTTVGLSALGLLVFVIRGEKGLAIDFTGGSSVHFVFKEKQELPEVRKKLEEHFTDVTVQQYNDHEFKLDTSDRMEALDKKGNKVLRFDADQVRAKLQKIFGDKLETVTLKATALKEAPRTDKYQYVVDLLSVPTPESAIALSGDDAARKKQAAIIASRVNLRLSEWFESKGAAKPEEFFKLEVEPRDAVKAADSPLMAQQRAMLEGEAQKDYLPALKGYNGLYDWVVVRFNLPEGTDPKEGQALVTQLTTSLSGPKSEQVDNVDSTLAGELLGRAFWAIILSWAAISLYLWFRFGSWTFGLAAVLCLMYDIAFVIGAIGVASFLAENVPFLENVLLIEQFKIDLGSVAAMLTLVGYCVNDTIVVFDRIREVRGKSPELTPAMINDSINSTLSRTLLTGVTTILVLFVLYVWGGPGVHLFSFVMLIGVLVGTSGSIFVASPLLLIFGEGKVTEVRHRPVVQGAEV